MNDYKLYIIHNDFERTYCGITNDLNKRLKQHNGIIKGGAKATRGREWNYYIIIEGFKNKIDCLRFEWRMHHPDGKKRKNKKYNGLEGRILSIEEVLKWWLEKEENKNYNFCVCCLSDHIDIIQDQLSNHIFKNNFEIKILNI